MRSQMRLIAKAFVACVFMQMAFNARLSSSLPTLSKVAQVPASAIVKPCGFASVPVLKESRLLEFIKRGLAILNKKKASSSSARSSQTLVQPLPLVVSDSKSAGARGVPQLFGEIGMSMTKTTTDIGAMLLILSLQPITLRFFMNKY